MSGHVESGGASPSARAGTTVLPLDISSYRARTTWIATAWCSRRSRAPPTRPKRCKGCGTQLVVLPPARPDGGRCNRVRGLRVWRRAGARSGTSATCLPLEGGRCPDAGEAEYYQRMLRGKARSEACAKSGDRKPCGLARLLLGRCRPHRQFHTCGGERVRSTGVKPGESHGN